MTTLDKALAEYARGEHRNIDLILNEIKTAKQFPVNHQNFLSECLRLIEELPSNLMLVIANLFLTEKQWFTLEPRLIDQCICLLTCISLHNSSVLNQLLVSACNLLFSVDIHLSDEDKHRFPSQCFDLAAKCLHELVLAIPQAEDQVLEVLKMYLPSWRRPAKEVFVPCCNLFALSHWALQHPFLSNTSVSNLMNLVFMQLIDLEAHIDMTDYSNQNSIFTAADDFLETSSFEKNVLQMLKVLGASDSNEHSKVEILVWLSIMYMHLMFDALPKFPTPVKMNKREWSQLCSVFRCMRTRFFQYVLPVQNYFTAFPLILAFVCSLRPAVVVSYAESLWNFVKDNRQPTESRVRCVAYLSDTLARSNYDSNEVLLELLHDMSSWCVEYTYFQRGRVFGQSSQMSAEHTLFYTVFEAVVYLLTYRQADLLGSRSSRESCVLLPLGQLINSPFRPLNHIRTELRALFCATASAHKLNWTIFVPHDAPELLLSGLRDDNADVASSNLEFFAIPSFVCPLRRSLSTISFASLLHLRGFTPSRRLIKACLDKASTDSRPKSKHTKLRTNHFNLKALAKLEN
ncbi:unnamed protein product [Schistocephalus solidus]|uniref:RNA polymerase I specific transcription initiation factor RRN3 n=1 Tax=Schistocephalus solidus TaxID=70667 RepID=A0A183TGW0_SCHSO|nr:unnamed protein product [Schistocephalus solidus]